MLPFTLKIHLPAGDPDGLRLIERSNWNGKAVVFPRPLYPQVRAREEFKLTGVYILQGPRTDGDGEMLYIGEGDPVQDRLASHHANKEFWTRAVFFVAGPGQLNKAHVQFLESRLIALAKAAKRITLDNGNTPAEPSLSEMDRNDMEVFLANMLGILPILGIQAFELSSPRPADAIFRRLQCTGRGITANGYEAADGFVVQAGSQAVSEMTPSFLQYFPADVKYREDLIARGVLVKDGSHFKFAQDYTFSSPSRAASIVFGCPSNGRTDWKDAKTGRTLKQIQEAQVQGN